MGRSYIFLLLAVVGTVLFAIPEVHEELIIFLQWVHDNQLLVDYRKFYLNYCMKIAQILKIASQSHQYDAQHAIIA
eukprot:TRINITY_DN4200_c0_g1_i1.p1 TRINITY_DN4200_c0_g1~~TRINITY_DN4200_c0_g1_i1.p1  ORF type:complete len:76 (-),score=7.30 TRINITY_DN4200_c0_g1_i1:102-329(-)